jgi:hypothetical protein
MSVVHDEPRLGRYMMELIREGLVQTIDPDAFSWDTGLEFESNLTEGFQAILDTHKPSIITDLWQWMPIHRTKITNELFEQMSARGLCRWLSGDSWVLVETSTAHLFLAYLAGAICGVERNFFPVTDGPQPLAFLAPPAGDTLTRLQALRYVAISQALPVPSRPIPPSELASFKGDHCEELQRLRSYLDLRLVALATLDDEAERDRLVEVILEEIHDDVTSLCEQMSKRKWPRIVFAGIGGIIAPALAIAAPIAAGGNALIIGLSVGSGVAWMGEAAYCAPNILRSPQFNARSPLIYAGLTQGL